MIDRLTVVCKSMEVRSTENGKIELELENIEDEGMLEGIQEFPDLKRMVDLIGSEELLQEMFHHEIVNHFRQHNDIDDFFDKFTPEEYRDNLSKIIKIVNLDDIFDVISDPEEAIIEQLKERMKKKRVTWWSRFCRLLKRSNDG